MLALRDKLRGLERALNENEAALCTERDNYAQLKTSAQSQLAASAAKIAELSAEVDRYRAVAGSIGSRIKWAISPGTGAEKGG